MVSQLSEIFLTWRAETYMTCNVLGVHAVIILYYFCHVSHSLSLHNSRRIIIQTQKCISYRLRNCEQYNFFTVSGKHHERLGVSLTKLEISVIKKTLGLRNHRTYLKHRIPQKYSKYL